MNEEDWQTVRTWAAQMQEYSPIPLERMPELELYMDQVITFMEKHLAFYRRNEQSKTLTPSMINNYVKEALLHRPVNKRYNRTHLAELMVVSMLKPVLTISDIACLKQTMTQDTGTEALYIQFTCAQDDAMKCVGKQVEQLCCAEGVSHDRNGMALLAMQLALRANAYRIASEKLLEVLAQSEPKAACAAPAAEKVGKAAKSEKSK